MRLGVLECAIEEDEDDSIRNAINKFQVEVLMNFLIKYRESGAALPSIRFDDPPNFDAWLKRLEALADE